MLKLHKKYSLPYSQRLIFSGLARDYPPLNAYPPTTDLLDRSPLSSLPGAQRHIWPAIGGHPLRLLPDAYPGAPVAAARQGTAVKIQARAAALLRAVL